MSNPKSAVFPCWTWLPRFCLHCEWLGSARNDAAILLAPRHSLEDQKDHILAVAKIRNVQVWVAALPKYCLWSRSQINSKWFMWGSGLLIYSLLSLHAPVSKLAAASPLISFWGFSVFSASVWCIHVLLEKSNIVDLQAAQRNYL